MKIFIAWASVIIWFVHLITGAGAGYAAIRLWSARRNPMIMRLSLFLLGYVIEVLSAIVLLFVARGVVLTLKFSAVLFGFMLVADGLRALLIIYVIKGPDKDAEAATRATSGAQEPDYWRREFREAVREELTSIKEDLKNVIEKLRRPMG